MKSPTYAVLLAAATAFAAGTAHAETTLSYGSYVTARHNLHTEAVEPYFRKIEADTNGSLKFKLYADGTMASGRNTLQAVRDGVLDMGLIVDLYVPAELKTSALLSELALFGENAMVMTAAVNEMQLLNCPSCLSDLDRNNIKPLAFYSTEPYHLLCRSEVSDLKSLRGKRIRGTGPWGVWINAMGAVPVNVTSSETYEALERGQIDCSVGPIAWLTSYALMDVVKYVIDLPMGTYHGGLVLDISKPAWAKRSDAEKASMLKHLPEAVTNVTIGYRAEDDNARKQAIEKGVKFVPPSEDLKALLAEHRKSEIKRVADLGKRRNVEGTEAIGPTFVGLVEKWTAIVAEANGDTKKYQAALDEHIYSKLKD